jgi:outer membrane protein assembly factor BamE (lipoprotein component of BamABCDE complex)
MLHIYGRLSDNQICKNRKVPMRKVVNGTIFALVLGSLGGCMTAAQHRSDVQDNATDRVTVGKVQREIRVGMSSADVIQILGSPNIVSTDDQRRENWVYDKIATDTAYSSSSGGVNALVLGFGGSTLGGLGAGGGRSTGASSVSQRTLTIIIKFDNKSMVRDFAYHTSRF